MIIEGGLSNDTGDRRLLATHHQPQNIHETFAETCAHCGVYQRIHGRMQKCKQIDAQHRKVKIMFCHEVLFLELCDDRYQEIWRPCHRKAQHHN